MSIEAIFAIGGAVVASAATFAVAASYVFKKVPKRNIKAKPFQLKWKELQSYCAHPDTWPQALAAADELLGKALVKRHIKGRNIGERLVSAQHQLTDNDAVWFAHKLCRKLQENPDMKLKKNDIKDALIGFRQALQDLGALPKAGQETKRG